MHEDRLKLARKLSVMFTYQCTAACADCGTLSTPEVKQQIPFEAAEKYILQAKSQGFNLIVFTGGEATLRWKDLLKAISLTRDQQLRTRLVTNGHWATNPAAALARVNALKEAGLHEISLSTGDQHIRFVPVERIVNAVDASISAGLIVTVMIEQHSPAVLEREDLLSAFHHAGISGEKLRNVGIVESPWMPLEYKRTVGYSEGLTVNRHNIRSREPCSSVLGTYTLQADGRVGSCCGIGMRLIPELNPGYVDTPLETIVSESEGDFVKLMLRYLGPFQILEWAAEKDPEIAWEDKYAHLCQACLHLYRDPRVGAVLSRHAAELETKVAEAIALEEQYQRVMAGHVF